MADNLNQHTEDRGVSACPAGVTPGAPLVELEHAFVTFPGMCALHDVSLVVRAGEHLAIRGGNGAGKSTLLRVLRGEQWLDQTRLGEGGVGSRGRVVWHTSTGSESSPLAGRNMSALISAAGQEAVVRRGWDLSGEELVAGGFADTAFPGDRRDPEQEAIIRSCSQRAPWCGACPCSCLTKRPKGWTLLPAVVCWMRLSALRNTPRWS